MKVHSKVLLGFLALWLTSTSAQTHGYGPVQASPVERQFASAYASPPAVQPSYSAISQGIGDQGMRVPTERTNFRSKSPASMGYGASFDRNAAKDMARAMRAQQTAPQSNVGFSRNETSNIVDGSVTIDPTINFVNSPQMSNTNEQVISNHFESNPKIDVNAGGPAAQAAKSSSSGKSLFGTVAKAVLGWLF